MNTALANNTVDYIDHTHFITMKDIFNMEADLDNSHNTISSQDLYYVNEYINKMREDLDCIMNECKASGADVNSSYRFKELFRDIRQAKAVLYRLGV